MSPLCHFLLGAFIFAMGVIVGISIERIGKGRPPFTRVGEGWESQHP